MWRIPGKSGFERGLVGVAAATGWLRQMMCYVPNACGAEGVGRAGDLERGGQKKLLHGNRLLGMKVKGASGVLLPG